MLVLSRKKNESIVINNNITICVVEIRGDKVRLGIEAPTEIPVHRQEVYEAMKREMRKDTERQEAKRKQEQDAAAQALLTEITKPQTNA